MSRRLGEQMLLWEQKQDEKEKRDWQYRLSDALHSRDLQKIKDLLETGIYEDYIPSSDLNLSIEALMAKYGD